MIVRREQGASLLKALLDTRGVQSDGHHANNYNHRRKLRPGLYDDEKIVLRCDPLRRSSFILILSLHQMKWLSMSLTLPSRMATDTMAPLRSTASSSSMLRLLAIDTYSTLLTSGSCHGATARQ